VQWLIEHIKLNLTSEPTVGESATDNNMESRLND